MRARSQLRRSFQLPLSLTLLVAAGCGGGYNAQLGQAACISATGCGIIAANMAGCTKSVPLTTIDAFAALLHFGQHEIACLAKAGGNCDAARRCVNQGNLPASCSDDSMSCAGNLLQTCSQFGATGGGKAITTFDCTQANTTCVAGQNSAFACAKGTCTGTGMCNGTKYEQCDASGILHEVDCALTGATCVVGELNIARCRGVGPSCTQSTLTNPSPPIRCDGDTLVSCYDSQEARLDCKQFGLRCVANPTADTNFGCALGAACDPATFSATCTGTSLTYCQNGLSTTIDCASYGFHSCSPATGGSCAP